MPSLRLAPLLRPWSALRDALGLPGHRRIWEEQGHAQIEVAAIDEPQASGLRQRLEQALAQLDAVEWAEVNALTKRVAVAYDAGRIDVGAIIQLITRVEGEAQARTQQLGATEHPADIEPLHRALAALAGDLVGLWLSVVVRIARLTPLPIEASSLVSLVENQPWLRAQVEGRLGPQITDLLLALTSAAANGVAQGPTGILVDIAHRLNLVGEIQARRQVWARREPELYANPRRRPVDPPVGVPPRPVPLPDGPIETWSNRLTLAGTGGFAATLAGTRDARRAADAFLAGLPKAGRLGREAFAAQLGRALAARGVLPMDPDALRRLDRVNTVVVDTRVLVTGRYVLRDVVSLSEYDERELHERCDALLDLEKPHAVRAEGPWALAPLAQVEPDAQPRGTRSAAKRLRRGGATVLTLTQEGRAVGLAAVLAELDPGAVPLAAVIREAGHWFVVAGRKGAAGKQLGADRVIARGRRLAAAVRELQRDGAVVMVIARRGKAPLAAADVGISLTRRSGRPQWAADLVAGRNLDDAAFIVHASAVAAEVSRRSAQYALAGSGTGALLALTGPRTAAGHRALAAVNGAAAAAMGTATWSAMVLARRPQTVPEQRIPWHALDPAEALELLDGRSDGLDEREAAHRRRRAPDQHEPGGTLEPFLAELANPLTPILGTGAAVSAVVGGTVDAVMVAGVIGVNAALGGVQRLRTSRAIADLYRASATRARVLRAGEAVVVPADTLVPGDVVALEAGEVVPADCRVLEASALEVDESSLTGESLPVGKSSAPVPRARLVAERTSMLYEGTTIAAGSGRAVVVATGRATESGRSVAAAEAGRPANGVELRLAELTNRVLPLSLAAGAGVAGAGLLRRWPLHELAGSATSLAVASVPEGLPLVANAAQLAAARRLSTRGALVRNPSTIEALGRVSVLCFDKTGTLTEGRIRLRCVSDPEDEDTIDDLAPPRRQVLAAALRATPARDDQGGPDAYDQTVLNATDQAVLAAAQDLGVKPDEGLGSWAPVTALPFEAGRGLLAVLGRCDDGHRLSVKGAPETVLPQCVAWRRPEGASPLDDAARQRLDTLVRRLAARGHRVLAVAERVASDRTELDEERVARLEFLGLLGLADPVRDTAAAAIGTLCGAGVSVVMVTGDHPSTAEAIATELGMQGGGRILTGAELDDLDEEALARALPSVTVFARVTPAQKVRIVRSLQRAGQVVAMTGDGANDAPSIRLADVGVALGARGTPAARAAADLVVTDDRIETIIDAIVEGRALWGSVRDALSILLGGNLGEIGFTVTASFLARRPPLGTRQLLLVNLMTDLAPALAIATRPPLDTTPATLLREGPDTSLGGALTRDITVRALATTAGALSGWGAARLTGTGRRAQTVGLVSLVGTQLGQTMVAARGSPLVIATGLGSAAALAGIVQTPGLSRFFGCQPLGPVGWAQAATAAALGTGASVLASGVLAARHSLAARTPLQVAAAGEGTAEGDLVGVLEVAANRQA